MTFSHVLLYDGECALCNKLVGFVLPRDRSAKFAFASLQSDFANQLLEKFDCNSRELKTFFCITDYHTENSRLLSRSNAGLFVLGQLGGIWSAAPSLSIVPQPVRDFVYSLIARNRYKLFGKFDHCVMPEPRWQDRFLDSGSLLEKND